MLEDIIISRVRVKILTQFLSHPGTIFHVRDIVRKVSEEINAVRRELAHMERAGMVSKEARANRLFYTMRKDYPLYYELLELVGKTSGLGADILKQKAKLGKIRSNLIVRLPKDLEYAYNLEKGEDVLIKLEKDGFKIVPA